jgi:hypothetical protein
VDVFVKVGVEVGGTADGLIAVGVKEGVRVGSGEGVIVIVSLAVAVVVKVTT